MISKYTLSIHGIRISPESALRMYDPLRVSLIYLMIAIVCDFIMECIFTFVVCFCDHDHGDSTSLFSMWPAAALSLFIAWFLLVRFHIHFPGFAFLVAIIFCGFDFEGILGTNPNYVDGSAKYPAKLQLRFRFMLMCTMACLLIIMGEQNFLIAASGVVVINFSIGIRLVGSISSIRLTNQNTTSVWRKTTLSPPSSVSSAHTQSCG